MAKSDQSKKRNLSSRQQLSDKLTNRVDDRVGGDATVNQQVSTKTLESLTQLQQELSAAQERERRHLADYQNLLRRKEGERLQLIRFANSELLELLLPVYDNLQKAAEQISDQGVILILDQFRQALIQAGVEEIEALGQKFDLETMEAVDKQGKGDWVISVLQKGYKLKDKVLIHAKVILGDKSATTK